MTVDEYYTAPPQDVFDDIKNNAIVIWETYDDTYGYQSEKINKIKSIKNVKDNAWYIVAMFDAGNIIKLLTLVKPDTRELIIRAMEEEK